VREDLQADEASETAEENPRGDEDGAASAAAVRRFARWLVQRLEAVS
jgi:hypothetical protein